MNKMVWSLKPPSILPLPAIRTPGINKSNQKLNQIIERVLTENQRELTVTVKKRVEMIKEELINNQLVPPEPMIESVENHDDTDVGSIWSTLMNSYTQWNDVPDEIARGYLDYKLFRTLDGWEDTNTPYDFFIETKFQNVKRCQAFVEEIAMRLPDALVEDNPYDALNSFMNVCLWSLSKELPLISMSNMENDSHDVKKNGVNAKRRAFFDGITMQQRMLVQDDSTEVMEALTLGGKSGDVAIVLSNTGKELMGDLALAYTLLALKLCDTVTFYAKRYTTSDYGATAVDVAGHISHLADPRNSDVWAVRHLGESLRTFVYNGQLKVEDDSFWCLPSIVPYWDMPLHLEQKLSRSKMVFLKGDLNYRRMLGDREWSIDTLATDVLSYWHVPICALRVLESNVACGIHPKISSRISKQDSQYLTNGKWGMIQFVPHETAKTMESKPAEITAESGPNQG